MNDTNKISWMALRYSNTKDNQHLQIGFSFLMGLILVINIAAKNYLFAAFILIASILIYQIKKREEDYIPIEIHNKGISIGNIITEYNRISAFCIDDNSDEEYSYLIYKLKDGFLGSQKIIIIEPEIDSQELRTFLLQHLSEKNLKQSTIDKIVNSF